MTRQDTVRAAVVALLIAGSCTAVLYRFDHALADEASAGQPSTGTITGVITYQSDPQHPWRLGRYYIKQARTGELAEAVVALSARGLKGPSTPRPLETLTIDQKDFQFTPETAAIRAGDRVRFTNSDAQIHNVQTAHPRQAFNVNVPVGGEHLERFPSETGIRQPLRIGCTFHTAMHAWVYVFDHPWFAVTAQDGKFRLTDIPAGQYQLDVVHPAGDLQAQRPITVKAGETVTVDWALSPEYLVTRKP